jgi:hypothetical protein
MPSTQARPTPSGAPRLLSIGELSELTEQQHRIEVAREALAHGQRCPAGDPMLCSRFWSIVDGQLRGLSLEESHARTH